MIILFAISIIPLLSVSGNPKVLAFTIILVSIFFSLWVYSIVKNLAQKTVIEITISKFRLILILLTLYISLLSIYFALTFPDKDDPKWLLPIIILGQIFFAWGLFYVITFLSKVVAIVDLKRNVKFIDYVGYIVLILFFPIGIWWLYPKIQSYIKT